MFPILYGKNETDFVDRGLGTLSDTIACRITEERNGSYELQLIYPADGFMSKSIVLGGFIKAKPSPLSRNLQIFRIYQIEKNLGNKITVSAEHISYILNGFPLPSYSSGANKTLSWVFLDAQSKSHALLDNNGKAWLNKFVFHTDFTGSIYEFDIKKPFTMRSLLGGADGRFLDKAHGEYLFDNFDIWLKTDRGSDKGVIVSYGRNLVSLELDNNDNSCYSHILPYATGTISGGEGQADQEVVVYSGEATTQNPFGTPEVLPLNYSNNNGSFTNDCSITKVKIHDVSDMFGENEAVNPTNVKAKANSYISKRRTEIGKYTETLDVSYQPFGRGYGLSDQIAADEVNLCDTVTVVYPKLGTNKKLEVNKTVFNVLTERYDSVEIGTPKSSFSDTIRSEVMT